MIGPLVQTDWLQDQLGADDLRIVDGSWYLPAMARDAAAEFDLAHIPGAVFFDIDANSDPRSPLPHTMPAPEAFAASVGALGISRNDRIVVYDGMGLFSAARVWWMFRAMGAANVAVLNGGLKAWQAETRPLEGNCSPPSARKFVPRPQPGWVTDIMAVKSHIEEGSACIVDARPGPRFNGSAPEPRPGLRSGHIPGSRSMPVEIFLAEDGRLKPAEALRSAFEAAGVDITRPIVTTCGSGITAAIPFLALEILGKTGMTLYDGSWAQWGSRPETPVKTG